MAVTASRDIAARSRCRYTCGSCFSKSIGSDAIDWHASCSRYLQEIDQGSQVKTVAITEMLLQDGSYLAIIVVLVLTGFGLPIPEEVPIVTAGILSAHGQLDPWMALASCLFGVLVGDCVLYGIGRRLGRSGIRKHRWWARIVKPHREEWIEGMIERHGLKVFFVARFLVGLRSPVYLAAGVLRVPFRRFLLIDLFCATTVIGLFFTLSYRYGTTITKWIRSAEVLCTAVVVLALAGVAIFYWRRRRRQPARDPETTEAALPEPGLSEVPPAASILSDGADGHANCPQPSGDRSLGAKEDKQNSKRPQATGLRITAVPVNDADSWPLGGGTTGSQVPSGRSPLSEERS